MRSIAAALAAAATVLAVVGCGGESDDPTVTPAAGQWAMDYCTSIASLQTPLEDAAEALQQAGTIETPDEAQSAFAPMGAAATTFAEDMGSLRPTDTPGAAEVQRETDSLAATVDRYLKQARASLDAWNAGTGSRSQTLSLVGSQLRAVRQELGKTTAAIRNVDSDVNAALTESTSCESLIEGLTS